MKNKTLNFISIAILIVIVSIVGGILISLLSFLVSFVPPRSNITWEELKHIFWISVSVIMIASPFAILINKQRKKPSKFTPWV